MRFDRNETLAKAFHGLHSSGVRACIFASFTVGYKTIDTVDNVV